MRYKRKNTLALDVSAVPTGHRLAVVQPLLTFLKLDPTKLTSVQFHSSRKTIFIGLPEDRSAAATAAKTSRFSITIDGAKIYVPLEFVDEDVIEVRVCDLPPETPTTVIQQTLRQYGEVLSVISEVWRDFFPGVPTGVKIARMKVAQSIPARISIGSSSAFISYDGQPRRSNSSPNADGKQEEKKKTSHEQATQQQQQQSRGDNNATVDVPQQKEQRQQQKRPKIDPPTGTSDPSSTDFTVVRRKERTTQQVQQQQLTPQNQPAPDPSGFNWQPLVDIATVVRDAYYAEEEKRKKGNSNNRNIK